MIIVVSAVGILTIACVAIVLGISALLMYDSDLIATHPPDPNEDQESSKGAEN